MTKFYDTQISALQRIKFFWFAILQFILHPFEKTAPNDPYVPQKTTFPSLAKLTRALTTFPRHIFPNSSRQTIQSETSKLSSRHSITRHFGTAKQPRQSVISEAVVSAKHGREFSKTGRQIFWNDRSKKTGKHLQKRYCQ